MKNIDQNVSVKIAFWIAFLIQIFYVLSTAYTGLVAQTTDPIHAFTLAFPLITLIILKRKIA